MPGAAGALYLPHPLQHVSSQRKEARLEHHVCILDEGGTVTHDDANIQVGRPSTMATESSRANTLHDSFCQWMWEYFSINVNFSARCQICIVLILILCLLLMHLIYRIIFIP